MDITISSGETFRITLKCNEPGRKIVQVEALNAADGGWVAEVRVGLRNADAVAWAADRLRWLGAGWLLVG